MSLSKDRPLDLERLRLKAEWEAAEEEEREFNDLYDWEYSDCCLTPPLV